MSYTKHWAWKSYRRDGCRVCSQWNKNGIAWQLQSTVWTCLSAIRKSFCGVSSLLTKHGSTITHQKTKEQSKQWTKSGECQRRQKRFHRPERSWPPVFGIREASFSPTIWRRERQSRDSTTLIYWTDSTLNWRKNDLILQKKKCSFTMITHQLIRHGKTGRITLRLWIVVSSLFSRFGPLRFLFISKHEKMAW